MIDAHCHLEKMKNPEKVVEEAMEKGMKGIVTSAPDPGDIEKNLQLSKKFNGFVFSNIGLHPTEIDISPGEMKKISDAIENKDVKAVGEIGLDYYHIRDKAKREETKKIFGIMIEMANSNKKPVVIHCRDAWKDCMEILKNAQYGVMLHCFTGNEKVLNEAIERDYMISLSTLIVKSPKLRWLAERVPLENLLLETDAPWLDPFSNELKNKPWNITFSADVIAREKEMLASEILDVAEKNARKFFGL